MIQGNILPTKILVKPVEKKEEVRGGIILPNLKPDPCVCADVILVGSGTPQLEIPIKVGQRVLFPVRAPQAVKIDETDFLLLDFRDVLFFYTPEADL